MIQKMKQIKGFTLVEILAVIVVLGILLLIGIPVVQKQIEKSKEQAFFNSVSNIVNTIKPINVIEEKDYCMYSYAADKENATKNINSMFVLVHKKNDKLIYSVYASRVEGKIGIDVYDFNTLNASEPKNWVVSQTDTKSYTNYATSLITIDDTNTNNTDLFQYKVCTLK